MVAILSLGGQLKLNVWKVPSTEYEKAECIPEQNIKCRAFVSLYMTAANNKTTEPARIPKN